MNTATTDGKPRIVHATDFSPEAEAAEAEAARLARALDAELVLLHVSAASCWAAWRTG